MVRIFVCLFLACFAITTSAEAQFQITTGAIQGSVLDSTGGVLPGVDVTVVNVQTNLTQSALTDSSGRFAFLQLPPGRYKATFRLSGFSTIEQDEIDLT